MSDAPTSTKLSANETKAIGSLHHLIEVTGAEWITETQWRARARIDGAHNIRIPDLLDKGAIHQSSALFHAPRHGHDSAPLGLFRPADAKPLESAK